MSETLETRDRAQTIVAFLKGEMSEEERSGFEERIADEEDLQNEIEKAKVVLDALSASGDQPVVHLVNSLIGYAASHQVSDIHILPGREQSVHLRFRIDGMLREVRTEEFTGGESKGRLSYALYQPVVDRIKSMADMNLAERRLPQDGRLSVRHQEKRYTLRVSTLPSLYGERVTIRILPEQDNLLGLDVLGYDAVQVKTLKHLCRARSGLVLVGGWAGSGRTTLLYSLLKEMQSTDLPLRNILTIEDPVELSLSAPDAPITQTSVNRREGMTIVAGLHSISRSDPDVAYCSDIADSAAAEIAVDLSLRGVLMLGALPVTGALAIIQRLRDMGIPDYRIADSLTGLVGLRLVRKIDTRQVETYLPEEEERERCGLSGYAGPFTRGVPTPDNGNTGFAGRLPLIEIVEVTPQLRRLIAEGADIARLAPVAFPTGRTLHQDACVRIKAGQTTVEEVNWALFDLAK